MTHLSIKKKNEVYIKISSPEEHVHKELSDYFTFEVPGARFMPAVRNKVWDGKIRLFNQVTRTIFAGLTNYIVDFCRVRNYDCIVESKLTSNVQFDENDVNDLAQSVGLTLEPRDYQKRAIAHAISNKRCLLLSPTASGKSLVIYMLARYYPGKKLIVVPTTSLVHQMASDFSEYGYEDEVQKITAGATKEITNEILSRLGNLFTNCNASGSINSLLLSETRPICSKQSHLQTSCPNLTIHHTDLGLLVHSMELKHID